MVEKTGQADRHASWRKVIAVNLAVLAAVFLPAEIAVRVVAPEYASAWFTEDVTGGNPIHRNRYWGHRVAEADVDEPLRRKDGERRVLFIGDSVTIGYGVPYEETYHAVAARDPALRDCGVFVHGLGEYHSNLKILLNSYRNFILDGFGADLVIYQFNVNDRDGEGIGKKKKDPKSLTPRERFEKFRISWLNRSAFLKAVQSVSMRQFERAHPRRLVDSLRYSPASDPEKFARRWRQVDDSLGELDVQLKARGIDIAVLAMPESFRLSALDIDNDSGTDVSGIDEWPEQHLARLAGQRGIAVIDPLSAMRAYRQAHPDERMFFPNDDNHPNRLGHEVLGGFVAQDLRHRLGCPKVADR